MHERWHRRAHRRLRHSLKARLVAFFLLLAAALAGTFLFGMQNAIGIGWRDAARPLVADYVDRLAGEIGTPPSVDRARSLTQRLPITVRIHGPQVQWESQPQEDAHSRFGGDNWRHESGLFARTTVDGHRIEFGLNVRPWRDRPRVWGWATLATLLLLIAVAYAAVRRLLRPLDDIRDGAQRFGRGDFGQPIPMRRRDELGDLAGDLNAMARELHQMLEAKRTLLLAISHELRSPITRARLNVELLPDSGEAAPRRAALLRDLQEMAQLVNDLLESERLAQGHAALHAEPADLADLVREATADSAVTLDLADDLPRLALDRTRMRLLLRNLVDNALRHGGEGQAPSLQVARDGGAIVLRVRDFGPGVAEAALPQLAQPFYRPDESRERNSGGVGLGLYLCKLVAQAHGAQFAVRNAQPGLEITIRFALPIAAAAA